MVVSNNSIHVYAIVLIITHECVYLTIRLTIDHNNLNHWHIFSQQKEPTSQLGKENLVYDPAFNRNFQFSDTVNFIPLYQSPFKKICSHTSTFSLYLMQVTYFSKYTFTNKHYRNIFITAHNSANVSYAWKKINCNCNIIECFKTKVIFWVLACLMCVCVWI